MLDGPALGFLLTTIAGMTTAIGALSAFVINRHKRHTFLVCLSLSAAAMLYVSFLELMVECQKKFFNYYVTKYSEVTAMSYAGYLRPCSFFAGWFATSLLSFLTDKFLEYHNSAKPISKSYSTADEQLDTNNVDKNGHMKSHKDQSCVSFDFTITEKTVRTSNSVNNNLSKHSFKYYLITLKSIILQYIYPIPQNPRSIALQNFAEQLFEYDHKQFIRIGAVNTVVLFLHNIPEGVASYVGSLERPSFGMGLAFAIAFHNIPEGFAVAVPIYYGTNSRKKAFFYSTLTGLAEPLGALLAYTCLKSSVDQLLFAWTLGITAGVMSNIAINELMATALIYDPINQITSTWFVFGMFLIAFTITGLNNK